MMMMMMMMMMMSLTNDDLNIFTVCSHVLRNIVCRFLFDTRVTSVRVDDHNLATNADDLHTNPETNAHQTARVSGCRARETCFGLAMFAPSGPGGIPDSLFACFSRNMKSLLRCLVIQRISPSLE